jgi:hypothetical protein
MCLITWLENNMLACPYKKYFGFDCFGCGMQRSIIALLKGNVVESFYFYPALIPIILMFLLLIAHIIYKFKNGAKWLKYNFILVTAIVVINLICKLVWL